MEEKCPKCDRPALGYYQQSVEGFHYKCRECNHKFVVGYDRRPDVAQTHKVPSRVEMIFSHAAALAQDGRLRNTIYCLGRRVYILNQDFTVLLRFNLRREEAFAEPVSFRANDYDSREFVEKNGRIQFIRRDQKWKSTKSCSTPERSPQDVEGIFRQFMRQEINPITIGRDLLPMLSEELSHVEFSCTDGKFHIIQRNIYDGTVIDIKNAGSKGLGLDQEKVEDFEPLGIRTSDLVALYSFSNHLKWRFSSPVVWIESVDPKLQMVGLISQCLYDELGGTTNGRQEQKDRRDKPGVDRADKGKTKRHWKEIMQERQSKAKSRDSNE